MPHPMKDQIKASYADKMRKITTEAPRGNIDHWSRAERISGLKNIDHKMERPPEEGVPQFENDRSERDVPYGSFPKDTVDD